MLHGFTCFIWRGVSMELAIILKVKACQLSSRPRFYQRRLNTQQRLSSINAEVVDLGPSGELQ